MVPKTGLDAEYMFPGWGSRQLPGLYLMHSAKHRKCVLPSFRETRGSRTGSRERTHARDARISRTFRLFEATCAPFCTVDRATQQLRDHRQKLVNRRNPTSPTTASSSWGPRSATSARAGCKSEITGKGRPWLSMSRYE